MYSVRFLQSALRDLKRLDATVANRIVRRLEWLAANFQDVTPEPLTGELRGLYKFRVGSYRVIYHPIDDEQVLLVYFVGHRSDVYGR